MNRKHIIDINMNIFRFDYFRRIILEKEVSEF